MARLILFLLAFSLTALSMPTRWSADEAKFYSSISKEIQNIRKHGNDIRRPGCELSDLKLPQSSKPLPNIPGGQKLLAVAVGRGTQNYTCESESEKPTPRGALATLFDASCIAANYPQLLASLTNAALHLQQPEPFSNAPGAARMPVMGHHFFSNGTTAVFEAANMGASSVIKIEAVDAPQNSLPGVCGQLDGAVPWLFLESIPESTGKAKSIYRVNTAGGSPPKYCTGQPKEITVQYSAEYWFYG
ncbi:predicted protein [Uncinocarpus reesii 1704]|uniref:Malate dehydrogenase n=1 Tax=Uncinocarpus reesii (strain UAMH 1704) TaxID=336963 RepID=C4JI79_UNCRE|nr:uncharacterized protein UREG_02825 [Uncinocarpus reesii 1704]EEP77976.1 predicted protein [Uncinocarpus reesii 1704]